ncbi:TPA: hypothetical protein N0F65_002654 [Lagenidium giganteum]|uniref:P-type ATPase A domain-containing protein n=1 Tax=Lagenidium giganteum TaxID=4803 RepID=A0AAV2Z4Q5_9STRA|nr:TPA: hypothetical protein N0F65_002654 [Lagenidium giganteum]
MVVRRRPATVLLLLLVMAGAVDALERQERYAGCPANHHAQYVCCHLGNEQKEVFTRYERPRGGDYEAYYEHAWRQSRQVNFPEVRFSPDTPLFQYDDAASSCRVHSIARSDGHVDKVLQCARKVDTMHAGNDKRIEWNASLAEDAQDFDVFWTSVTSPRNNNATIPVGAVCTSLMRPDGTVDMVARLECVSPVVKRVVRFRSLTDMTLVAGYLFYAFSVVAIMVWAAYRHLMVLLTSRAHRQQVVVYNNKTLSTSSTSDGTRSTGCAKLLGNRYGPTTPILADANTSSSEQPDASSRMSLEMEDIENTGCPYLKAACTPINYDDKTIQIGYCDSLIGTAVKWYIYLATFGFFPIAIVLIMNANGYVNPPLFEEESTGVGAFLVIWTTKLVWFVTLASVHKQFHNLFRMPTSNLHEAKYVHIFKAEASTLGSRVVRNSNFTFTSHSMVSRFLTKLEAIFHREVAGYEETVVVQRVTEDGERSEWSDYTRCVGLSQLLYIEFQHMRYIYEEDYGKFVPASLPLAISSAMYSQIYAEASTSDGLVTGDVVQRRNVLGKNHIVVKMPSFPQSILDELFGTSSWRFFYIYQLLCYYVWYYWGHTRVALANTIIILVVAVVNIMSKRQMLKFVIQMTQNAQTVAVKRNGGVWQIVKAAELVPGDIVRVAFNWEAPCDMVLFHGPSVVVDESMLTGEPMPVQKFPIPPGSNDYYDPEGSGKRHTLLAGTKTLSTTGNVHEEEVLAVVQATGAHTVRGKLLQSILYPLPLQFKFYQHMKVLVVLLLLYGIISSYFAVQLLASNDGLKNKLAAVAYGVFILSAVLSPLIPIVMTINQVTVTKRLRRKHGIMSLNPERIILPGKVRVFCFDKTGTITKEGLEYRGCLPVTSGAPVLVGAARSTSFCTFGEEVDSLRISELEEFDMMKYCMASCHALRTVNGSEIVGNEVEMKMFASTQWKLYEQDDDEELPDGSWRKRRTVIVFSPDESEVLQINKQFEFDHDRMCMSVIATNPLTKKRYIFCKGAYEQMQSMCTPCTIPPDYHNRADGMARKHGCYVLSMGFRDITDLSEQQVQELMLKREAVESGLTFLGLILFQNELKEDSRRVIQTLKEGDVRVVMITGDNAMTACHIAKECGMVSADARVILGDILSFGDYQTKALVWKDLESNRTFTMRELHAMLDVRHEKEHNTELAVTQRAFEYLVKMEEIQDLLFHIRIFSRMTPTAKVDCVAQHMALGAVTGMCGDGGNDCGALRMAHVGIALTKPSDAESSDASDASLVAPFTSSDASIACVIELIREGRCCLATTFATLKFLIVYGLIGSAMRFAIYGNGVFISTFGFIFLDGPLLVGFAYVMTLAKPFSSSSQKLERFRPSSSLLGPATMLSVILQVVIHGIFLHAGLYHLRRQPWYCPFSPIDKDLTKGWLLEDTVLGSTVFFLISSQAMVSAIAFSLGSTFRVPLWRNYFVVGYFGVLFGFVTFLLLSPPNAATDLFRIASGTNVIGLPDVPMPSEYRVELFFLIVINMVVAIAIEYVFVVGPVRRLLRRQFHRDALRLRV